MQEQSTDSSWLLKNIEETIELGAALVTRIPELSLLFLNGPLGAGKTSVVKGLALGLDITETITSPTFALAQHYRLGKRPLIHVDLYRLENKKAADEIFFQELEEATNLNAVLAVEWPERLSLSLHEGWNLKLDYLKSEGRIAHLKPPESFDKNFSMSSIVG